MRLFGILLPFLLSLGGCATSKTIVNNDTGVKIDNTHCEQLNHVFSGTQYYLCHLWGEADPGGSLPLSLSWGPYGYADFPLSLAADLVVLPYTLYRNASSAPIPVLDRRDQK